MQKRRRVSKENAGDEIKRVNQDVRNQRGLKKKGQAFEQIRGKSGWDGSTRFYRDKGAEKTAGFRRESARGFE